MAKALGGGSPIKSGALQAARASASGFEGPFFPPGAPLPTMAPPSVAGRAFDFPVGVNLQYTPRSQQGVQNISFETLRRLADPAQGGLDLLRAAIEKRKKEMKAQTFKIVGREGTAGGDRAKRAQALFAKPDGRQRWRTWLGQLLEDHFVIDAPTVFFRWNGETTLLEQIDGSLITLLVDDNGRTPAPPLPAYEQILKGLPALRYTTEELGYYMDNPRPGRLYGLSAVEQVVTIVTIALNRQLSILNYFTEGTVPDMLIGVPATWQASQIEQFQTWWDSMLSGQLGERRKARFYPGEMKPFETKPEILKGDFDEWIARVICFCMDLSPESLVKQTNRATADTGKEAAQEQGLEPTKIFVKDAVDDMLARMGAEDLELLWEDEEITDPVEKATVILTYRGGMTGGAKPIITLDEAREMAGLKPATPEQRAELEPPEPEPVDVGGDPSSPDDPSAPPSKGTAAPKDQAAKSRGRGLLPAVPTNRKAEAKLEKTVNRIAKAQLAKQKKRLIERVQTFSKATQDEILGLVAYLKLHPWDDDALGKLRDAVGAYASERSRDALDHLADAIGGTDDDFSRLLDQANENAVEWARSRVSNLVKGLDESSGHALNEITAQAIESGLTNDELAELIGAAYAFSPERSLVIARTETAEADSQGTMIGYRASGVVTGKSWDPDAEACPVCQGNAADGVIGLDETFSSGDDAPPAHPNCECSVIPVVDSDAES